MLEFLSKAGCEIGYKRVYWEWTGLSENLKDTENLLKKGMSMDAKEIKLDCPCCKAELILDAATGGVIKFFPHKEAPTSLEQFMKLDKTRSQDLASKFDEAKKIEDGRLDLLNKKFEWAKKNKDKLPEAKPGILWD